MKPGQTLTRWWQEYVLGRLRSPQHLTTAAHLEAPDAAQASERFFDLPSDIGAWDVPERLQAPNFMRTDAYLKQWDRADWQHVDRRLMRWSALFIEYARKRNIPLYVHSAYRTREEQQLLLSRNVTRTLHSAHRIGEAVDIVHGVYHWDMTPQEWRFLQVIGNRALDRVNATLKKADKLELTWGGNWSFYDPAHWQITDYKTRFRQLPDGLPVRYTPRRILRMI